MNKKQKELGRLILGIILFAVGIGIIAALMVRWFFMPEALSDDQSVSADVFLVVGIVFTAGGTIYIDANLREKDKEDEE